MNNLWKQNNRKHEVEYVWTFPQRRNKNGAVYHAYPYVLTDDGKNTTVTRGLDMPGTPEYSTNLAKREQRFLRINAW